MTFVELMQQILKSRGERLRDVTPRQAWEMACDLAHTFTVAELQPLSQEGKGLLASCVMCRHAKEMRRAYGHFCPDGESPAFIFAGFPGGQFSVLGSRFLKPGLDIRDEGKRLGQANGDIPVWYTCFEPSTLATCIQSTPYDL